ncbi:glutaminase [Serratia ureilytica]
MSWRAASSIWPIAAAIPSGEAVISPLAGPADHRLMMTSGMCDGAGEFAYRVGMPASPAGGVSWPSYQ